MFGIQINKPSFKHVFIKKRTKYPDKHGVRNPKHLKGNLPIRTATGVAMAHHGGCRYIRRNIFADQYRKGQSNEHEV